LARKPAEQAVNRLDILRAAANVFRRQGYHGAKMADIAAEVALTAGSLYHHFPQGKQQLLIEVLNEGLDEITAEIRAIVEDDTLLPDEKLKKIIYTHILSLTQNVSVAAALVFETRTILEEPDARDAYLKRRDTFEGLYRQVIQAGIDAGIFRPVDAPIFAKTILGAHNWVGVWYREGGRLSGEQIAEEMTRTFLTALRPLEEVEQKPL
jgi:AcrR family transcriptional regulator